MNPKIFKTIKIYRNFVLFSIVDAVCVIILIIYVVPTLSSLNTIISKIQTQNKENENLKKKVRFLNELDYDQLAKNTDIVLEVLPVEKSIPSFIATLDNLTSSNGINMLNFTISKAGNIASNSSSNAPSDKQIVKDRLTAQVSLSSTIDSLKSFVNKLSSVRKIMHILQISLSFESQDSVSADADIATYFSDLPQKLDKIDKIEPFTDQEESLLNSLESLESMRQIYEISPLDSPNGMKANPFSQ